MTLGTHLCPLLQPLVELVDAVVRLPHVRRMAPVKLGERGRIERVRIHVDHLNSCQVRYIYTATQVSKLGCLYRTSDNTSGGKIIKMSGCSQVMFTDIMSTWRRTVEDAGDPDGQTDLCPAESQSYLPLQSSWLPCPTGGRLQ